MKRKKNKKLHGSVLLTVVVVMSLLIVFLFGTLALATAANNRAHVNYSSAQTNVTSRMVVDAAVKAMKADANYGNVISKIGTDAGASSLNVAVKLGNTVPNAGKYGDISPVNVSLAGKKKFYDTSKKEWVEGDILKFSASVSMAGVNSTTSAYIVKQPPTEATDGAGGGAGFVTTSGANVECQTNLFGGSYINLPRLGVNVGNNKDANGKHIYDDGTDTKGAIFYDYSYRATDEEYANWQNDASVYRQFDTSDALQLTNANADFSVEADLYVNSNLNFIQAPNFIFPSKGKGITVWGDMTFTQSADVNRMKFVMPFDMSSLNFNEVPYIFVDGAIKINQNVTLGQIDTGTNSNKHPLNIFCGYFQAGGANDNFKLGGDLYCMDPYRENNLEFAQSTVLYQWAGSVVNKAVATPFSIGGKISAKGTTKLKNIETKGDVRIEKDCHIGDNVKIGGNLIVGGNLYITGDASKTDEEIIDSVFSSVATDKKIYCDHIYINGEEYKTEQEAIDFKVPNYELSYVHYIVKNVNAEARPVGLFDEPLYDVNIGDIVTYRWRDIPSDWDESQIYIWANGSEDWMIDNARNLLKQESGWPKKPYEVPSTEYGDVNIYYIKTLASTNPSDPKAVKLKDIDKSNDNILKLNPGQKLQDRYTVLADASQPISNAYTIQTLPATTISNDKIRKVTDFYALPEYNGDAVYPKYAEKEVILGLEEISGIDIKETKIIKRLEEVLDDSSDYYVSNPYKYESLSVGLGAIYNNDLIPNISKTGNERICFTSNIEIVDTVGKIVKNVTNNGQFAGYEERAIDGGGNKTVTQQPYELDNKPVNIYNNLSESAGIYIDRSCILDGVSFGSGYSKNIVINPDNKDILIVIKNSVNIDSSIKFIIDDRKGGTVNFYLESGAELNFSNGQLTTVRYETMFKENQNGELNYNSSGKSGYDLSELGKPKVNVYGAANTKMTVSNGLRYIVANILSPNIEFVAASTGPGLNFSNIYYNGSDILNPDGVSSGIDNFVFGCVNSKQATLPNRLNVIFVDDKEGTDPDPIGDGASAFSYRILYYDEY